MDGLSSDDDEVQFTGTLDADAARERDRRDAEREVERRDADAREADEALAAARDETALLAAALDARAGARELQAEVASMGEASAQKIASAKREAAALSEEVQALRRERGRARC